MIVFVGNNNVSVEPCKGTPASSSREMKGNGLVFKAHPFYGSRGCCYCWPTEKNQKIT